MSAGAGGDMYGGGGTFDRMMKGYGGVQNSTGMMRGGPQANYNNFNRSNTPPQARAPYDPRDAAVDPSAYSFATAGGLGTDKDPRRSPDVAMPWRVGQGTLPYSGPVTGNVQPPNPSGYYPYGPHASMGSAAAPGGYNPMASPSPGGAPMQIGGAEIPYWQPQGLSNPAAGGAGAAGRPNMFAGGNPNFNERAPMQWQGLLGRGSY